MRHVCLCEVGKERERERERDRERERKRERAKGKETKRVIDGGEVKLICESIASGQASVIQLKLTDKMV